MACITLLSDFGLQDASVAIAKGVLMQHSPGLLIADISHEVRPFHTGQAAYLLSCAWRNFPGGTCHLLLFDVFSDKVTRLLLAEHHGHYFLTADNGVLPLALSAHPMAWQCKELKPAESFTAWLHAAGQIISKLQTTLPGGLDLPSYRLKTATKIEPLVQGNEVTCEVIHIDHYENVVLNITKQQFEALSAGRSFRLQFVQVEEITEISGNYADVRPGIKLCRFNSNGYMEICVNRGNAASLFGLRPGSRNNDIKITFG